MSGAAINEHDLWDAARVRYHHEGLFHYEVEQAVSAAMAAFPAAPEAAVNLVRNVVTDAVILALALRENGREADRG